MKFLITLALYAVPVFETIHSVGCADVSEKLLNSMLKSNWLYSPKISNEGALLPNYQTATLKKVLPQLVAGEFQAKTVEPALEKLQSSLVDLLPGRLSSIESELENKLGRVEELDAVEEQANLDLVKGINLMAEHNETIDDVVDEVLQEKHQDTNST